MSGVKTATTPLKGGVIGIDLSLTSTGVAFIGDAGEIELINFGRKGKRNEPLSMRGERVDLLASSVTAFATAGGAAALAVIESPSFGSNGGSAHDRSGAWWLVVCGLLRAGIPVAQVAPTTRAKYAAGNGRAKKDEVMSALRRSVPGVDFANDDQADALALALMGARHLGTPREVDDLPSERLVAMESVQWPMEI